VNPKRRVEMTRRAKRDLDDLDVPQRAVVVNKISQFAAGELNSDIRKLQGYHPARWRLRIGEYRAILTLEGHVIIVERVLLRRDAYH